jgi:large subunit ribosomal protein L22
MSKKMNMSGYTQRLNREKEARALGKELPISPKHSVEICKELKGMLVDDAKDYLEDVIALEKAVPFKRHIKRVPHRKGKGLAAGRFPKKAAAAILSVLESAESNASHAELSDRLRIKHITASRGQPWSSWRPRAHGRSTPLARETVNIEIIVEEVEEE